MPTRTHVTATAAIASLLGAAALFGANPVAAKDEIDPAAYPELTPEALLPAILAEMRHDLPDVYSVREVRLCPANKIKLKDGKPNDWAVRLEFNAKNQSGGYTGIQRDVVVFRNGRVAYPIGTSPQLGRTGLDGVFSKMVDKQMAGCIAIPDATIQQTLATAK